MCKSLKRIKVETLCAATAPSTHICLFPCGNCPAVSSLPLCTVIFSLPALRRGARSDRCNTAAAAWAELAGCRGQTRASSSDRRDTAEADDIEPWASQQLHFSCRLIFASVRIWLCWSGSSPCCEFNMDPDTSAHQEAQNGEWDLKWRRGWKKLRTELVNKGVELAFVVESYWLGTLWSPLNGTPVWAVGFGVKGWSVLHGKVMKSASWYLLFITHRQTFGFSES